MERFIGLDEHKASTTIAVMGPTGRRLRSLVVETHGRALIEAMRVIPGNKHLCLENGAQAMWIAEILRPHVSEVRLSTGSVKPETSADEPDAFALAQLVRAGMGQPLHAARTDPSVAALRIVVKTYNQVTQDLVRTKNRLQVLYRSRGVMTPSGHGSLYDTRSREKWLGALPAVSRPSGVVLFAELDGLVAVKKQALSALKAEAGKHPMTRVLMTCPGMGVVRAAEVIATVVTPHRFRSRTPFWAYCGLSVVTRSSADWHQDARKQWTFERRAVTRGLTRSGNRRLKTVFVGAAVTAVARSPEVKADYLEKQRHMKPPIARIAIARKLAAITLSMWKHQEAYDPSRYTRQK